MAAAVRSPAIGHRGRRCLLIRSPAAGSQAQPAWPGLALIVARRGVLGAPIFAILGGAAVVLFMTDGVTPATVLIETYALSVSPTLPAIPLFTLAGFLLAEGGASERLLRVFRAWFGWIPGGTAVVCAVLCSFFTVFTGGSGVTILALGGVLFPALVEGRLPRAVRARPDDGVRIARTAAAAGAAAHPLRRRRADSDRGSVHRRHPARHPADDDDRGVGRARGDRLGRAAVSRSSCARR